MGDDDAFAGGVDPVMIVLSRHVLAHCPAGGILEMPSVSASLGKFPISSANVHTQAREFPETS